MSEWISVEDRLPITKSVMKDKNYDNIEVIVATKNYVTCDYFEAGNVNGFWSQFSNNSECVTHWQPLPEPPK